MKKSLTNDLNFNNGDINNMYDPDEARLERSIQRYKNNMITSNLDALEAEEETEEEETYRITLSSRITSIKKVEENENETK